MVNNFDVSDIRFGTVYDLSTAGTAKPTQYFISKLAAVSDESSTRDTSKPDIQFSYSTLSEKKISVAVSQSTEQPLKVTTTGVYVKKELAENDPKRLHLSVADVVSLLRHVAKAHRYSKSAVAKGELQMSA